jgi:hypothetical protein
MVMPTNRLSGEFLLSMGFSGIKPESMTKNQSRMAQKIAQFEFKRKVKR